MSSPETPDKTRIDGRPQNYGEVPPPSVVHALGADICPRPNQTIIRKLERKRKLAFMRKQNSNVSDNAMESEQRDNIQVSENMNRKCIQRLLFEQYMQSLRAEIITEEQVASLNMHETQRVLKEQMELDLLHQISMHKIDIVKAEEDAWKQILTEYVQSHPTNVTVEQRTIHPESAKQGDIINTNASQTTLSHQHREDRSKDVSTAVFIVVSVIALCITVLAVTDSACIFYFKTKGNRS